MAALVSACQVPGTATMPGMKWEGWNLCSHDPYHSLHGQDQLSTSGKTISIFSVKMSLSIFSKKCCCSACYAWWLLGYVANENILYSGLERNKTQQMGKAGAFIKFLTAF
jgi:hypothetical protein